MRRLLICLILLGACDKKETPEPEAFQPRKKKSLRKEGEPDRMEVQLILISFKGRLTGVDRPYEAAEKLAGRLYDQAKAGADFQELAQEGEKAFQHPKGIVVANYDVQPVGNEIPRRGIARWGIGLGDAIFALKPGEITMVPPDSTRNPLGWFIIKRPS